MPKSITYKKDWINEFAEKEGLDIYQATDIIDSIVLFTKKVMRKPEVVTIRLRNVGKLYTCLGSLKRTRKFYSGRRKSTNKKLEDAIDNKIKIIEEHHKKYPFRYSRYLKMVNIKNFYFTDKRTLEELENLQNNG